ncbi:MAG: hypothetical protein ACK5MJ_03075 [Alphaproteobacteria bacterium]
MPLPFRIFLAAIFAFIFLVIYSTILTISPIIMSDIQSGTDLNIELYLAIITKHIEIWKDIRSFTEDLSHFEIYWFVFAIIGQLITRKYLSFMLLMTILTLILMPLLRGVLPIHIIFLIIAAVALFLCEAIAGSRQPSRQEKDDMLRERAKQYQEEIRSSHDEYDELDDEHMADNQMDDIKPKSAKAQPQKIRHKDVIDRKTIPHDKKTLSLD